MQWYQDLIRQILNTGQWSDNRTGVKTKSIPFQAHTFDLSWNFPAITLKHLPHKSVVGELLGFIRGVDNAAEFRELNCRVWNDNANKHGKNPNPWLSNPNRKGEDDLGRIYGVQWRNWEETLLVSEKDTEFDPVSFDEKVRSYSYKGDIIKVNQPTMEVWQRKNDQLANVIHDMMHNPTSRRMIISAWNVSDLNKMALVPCHVLQHYLCVPDTTSSTGYRIDLTMYQRSCDTILGLPFNIASYATMVHILSRITGHNVGLFNYVTGDTHIYEEHLEAANEILERKPVDCNIESIINPDLKTLSDFEKATPDDFKLKGYLSRGKLKSPTPMMV